MAQNKKKVKRSEPLEAERQFKNKVGHCSLKYHVRNG